MQINKNGQIEFQNFKENSETQSYIKKENESQEEEFNAYEFYEY